MVLSKKTLLVPGLILALTLVANVFTQYMSDSYIEDIFMEAASEIEMPRMKRDTSSQKLQTSKLSSVQKTTSDSEKIHNSFKIALRASKKLKANNTMAQNQTRPLKIMLRAPPRFCPFQIDVDCDGPAKYRKLDGSCNNPENPLIGKASTPFKRLLRAAYQDDVDEPRRLSVNGEPLPNPRLIALKVHDPLDAPTRISHLAVIFGQFMDHDMSFTASVGFDSAPLQCMCDSDNSDCINIPTPDEDMFTDQQCMVLTRSAASFEKFDCTLGTREQLNLLTHWLDLSQTYGNDIGQHNKLRAFRDGFLKTSSMSGFGRKEYLPHADRGKCSDESDEVLCFEAGDVRTSQNLMLVSVHTLWLREHNRIARILKRLNPTWSDEDLYQEARRINIAQYQNIIYSEWLPAIVGQDLMKQNGLEVLPSGYFMGYNKDMNPHIATEFSSAGFRFGHTLLRSQLTKNDRFLSEMSNLTLNEIMLRPVEAYKNGGLDSICRGMLVNPGTSFDTHFTDVIQNHLFETSAPDVQTKRFSLSAINIMRGRDHGIPPYNEFRQLGGLPKVNSIDDFKEFSPEARDRLKMIYRDVNDIDAYTGITSELPRSGSVVGITVSSRIEFK